MKNIKWENGNSLSKFCFYLVSYISDNNIKVSNISENSSLLN